MMCDVKYKIIHVMDLTTFVKNNIHRNSNQSTESIFYNSNNTYIANQIKSS